MSEKKKGTIIFLAIGLAIAIAVVALKWSADGTIIHKLCDGFFVSGVLLFGMGGLKFFRNKGAFDMITYGVASVLYITFPSLNEKRPMEQRNEDFYGYSQRKQEERKSADELLISGAVFLVLAVVMMVLYVITG